MLGQQLWLVCWLRPCFYVGAALISLARVSSARRGSLALIPSCLPALKMVPGRESFCLAAVSDAATKKNTNRPLAVVEAREELHTQRRADRDERAHKINGKSERGPVVRDVLGQAVPVVLAASSHRQPADGAAGT